MTSVLTTASLKPSTLRSTRTVTKRQLLAGILFGNGILAPIAAAELSCRGLNGYDLRQCLREKRLSSGESDEEVRESYLRTRQFEQPGELITLPNGLQYREMETGVGREIQPGADCSVSYIVYRLSSGAYFKYSSGGTPIYLFSLGYGYEGKDDFDGVYQFKYGDEKSLPLAATLGMSGMAVGSRRRILIPPRYGWVGDAIGPKPDTFGGYRRLEAHRNEPLLFEVELKRLRLPSGVSPSPQPSLPGGRVEPFALPAPPGPTHQ